MSEARDEHADWYENERLHRAAESGDLEEIQALLADGFPIDAFDDLSYTPLHRAAVAGEVAAVHCLLQAGADPTIPGWMMLTALDKSAERKKPGGKEVHRLLVGAAKRLNPNWSHLPKFAAQS